jgi:hypothetical protein
MPLDNTASALFLSTRRTKSRRLKLQQPSTAPYATGGEWHLKRAACEERTATTRIGICRIQTRGLPKNPQSTVDCDTRSQHLRQVDWISSTHRWAAALAVSAACVVHLSTIRTGLRDVALKRLRIELRTLELKEKKTKWAHQHCVAKSYE